MFSIRLVGLIGFGVVLLAPRPGAAQAGKGEDLYGDWDLVGMVYKGTVQDPAEVKGGTLRVERGKLFLRYKEDNQPTERRIQVRPGAGGGELDWTDGGGLHRGLYELRDGTLRIIIAWAGDPRPTGFDAEKNERSIMYTLQKRKK